MKVDFVLFEGAFGGPHRRVLNTAAQLQEAGLETTVICPRPDDSVVRQANERAVDLVDAPIERIQKGLRGILRWLIRFPMEFRWFNQFFRAELRSNPETIVHLNGFYSWSAAVAALFRGAPIVWHLNDTVLSQRLSRMIGPLIAFAADKVICQGERLRQHYGLESKRNVEIIYSTVDDDFIRERRDWRRFVTPGNVTVLHIGNWSHGKAQDIAMATATHLPQGWTLKLIGGVPATQRDFYASTVRRFSDQIDEGKILIEGFAEDIKSILDQTSVVIVTSRYGDACPNVILEAFSRGVPVVSVEVGSACELLARAGYTGGICVPTGKPGDIADAVRSICANPDVYGEYSSHAYTMASLYYTTSTVLPDYLRLYQDCL